MEARLDWNLVAENRRRSRQRTSGRGREQESRFGEMEWGENECNREESDSTTGSV